MGNDNVYALYKPVYHLSKLILLAPYLILKQRILTRKQINHHRFFLTCLATFLIAITVLALLDVATMHPIGDSLILINMDRATLGCNLILMLIALYTAVKNRKTIPKLLNILQDFDDSVWKYFSEELNSNGHSKKQINLYFLHMLACSIFLILEFFYGLWICGSIQFYNVSFFIAMIFREVTVLQYITVLNLLFWRFDLLNNLIMKMACDKKKDSGHNKSKLIVITVSDQVENTNYSHWDKVMLKKIKDNITMFRILHESLTVVCRNLSHTYGLFHAIAIITGMLEELRHCFAIFITLSNDVNLSDGFLYISLIREIFYMYVVGVTQFYFVFYFCDAVKKERENTGNSIHNFFLKTDYKEEVAENVRVFSLQLQQNVIVFSAAEIFSLDWALMSEVVGEISSYLIFFIQSSGFSFSSYAPMLTENENMTTTYAPDELSTTTTTTATT